MNTDMKQSHKNLYSNIDSQYVQKPCHAKMKYNLGSYRLVNVGL